MSEINWKESVNKMFSCHLEMSFCIFKKSNYKEKIVTHVQVSALACKDSQIIVIIKLHQT